MKRWIIVTFFAAMLMVADTMTHAAPALSAESLLADIHARGARAVVAALRSESGQWDQVMGSIGHGSREWLNVAAALRPGTDAGSAETLDEAVFLALKHQPIRVLQLLKDGTFEIATVCSSNIATDYPDAQSRRFIDERMKVLQAVSDENTRATRTQCLAGLRTALAQFDKAP